MAAVTAAAGNAAAQREVTERAPTEWSAETVVYWAEHVFGSRAAKGAGGGAVNGQRLLSLDCLDLQSLKVTDMTTLSVLIMTIKVMKSQADTKSSGSSGVCLHQLTPSAVAVVLLIKRWLVCVM